MNLTNNLSLEEVEHLLGFQKLYDGSFAAFLELTSLTPEESQELLNIRRDFDNYLSGKSEPLEGQIRLISLAPLLRLAGFYQYPMYLKAEENIDRIYIEDRDITITGRLDILAINQKIQTAINTPLYVLVIETKQGGVSSWLHWSQLLVYAYEGLKNQPFVWGLVTNGVHYEFTYIQKGNPSTYQHFGTLNLFDLESSTKLLQVLKAIRHQATVST